MKLSTLAVLVAIVAVAQSTVILVRKDTHKEGCEPKKIDPDCDGSLLSPCMADSLSDMLTKVADPKNRHFEDFQRHLGKVIDVLHPDTEPEKIDTRVEKFVKDIGVGLNAFDKHHPDSC